MKRKTGLTHTKKGNESDPEKKEGTNKYAFVSKVS